MVRMKELAAELGLSQTTISHVLSGRHREFRISPLTVARVQDLADKRGYRPSALARSLRERQAYSVGLIVEDLTNPFWTGVAMGAEREAQERGYLLVVSNTNGHIDRERQALGLLRDGRVDGLLVPPFADIAADLAALARERLPFVQIDRALPRIHAPCVRTDHELGARLAVEHLVARGHERIALLVGPDDVQPYRLRTVGFRKATSEHRLKASPILRVASPTEDDAQAAVSAFLSKRPRATALFSANIRLTIGALRAVRDADLEIPRDLELVGFDDLALADLLRFPVTTVVQDVEAIGRQAFRILMDVRQGESMPAAVLVPPSLIVR
jgi:LacI family transcriptional regulator